MAVRFAIWDLHLYLDTHCEDGTAEELLKKYKEQYIRLLEEYTCKYGCISSEHCHGENWLKSPFPWDNSGSDC